ncbi:MULTISPECIES: glucose-6-phosphate isomerase [Aminobacterium]|jgi:glucose-6-phosphate isomerase|uniref:glucose-6-phosphate isomerase n=1 Tax=Aminobacterium TaxID=81466 RepID=UPI00046395B9|nr:MULTISPECIES: glucose-6-phosphate isomerase [Aminobacterium]
MKPLLQLHLGAALGSHLVSGGATFQELQNLSSRLRQAAQQIKERSRDGLQGTGWLLLPYSDPTEVMKVGRSLASFDALIQIGIGGSALGNQMLHSALLPPYWNEICHEKGRPRFYISDNVDSLENMTMWKCVDPKRTALIVASKSGSTAETMANFLFSWERLERAVGKEEAARQTVVITDLKESLLKDFALEQGCLTLELPSTVGGRYSVLSPVGLLSAAALGIDVPALLCGAREMAQSLVDLEGMEQNPAWVFAGLTWLHYLRGRNMIAFIPYLDGLAMFSDWFAQLWGESLGKAGRGSTPIKALGTIDQHSQLQLYTEGPDDKLYVLVHVKHVDEDITIPLSKDKSLSSLSYLFNQSMNRLRDVEQLSTASALIKAGRPVLWVEIPKLDAKHLGGLIYFFEFATALTGGVMDVNPFDQPGVEQGKHYTYGLMERPGYQSFAEEARGFSALLSQRTIAIPSQEKC